MFIDDDPTLDDPTLDYPIIDLAGGDAPPAAGTVEGTGAGRYGLSAPGGLAPPGGILSSILAIPRRPFAGPLSAVDVFLLVGVVGIASMLWGFVLYHIRLAASEA